MAEVRYDHSASSVDSAELKRNRASNVALPNDYDVLGWLRDRFGVDINRHYVGTTFRIVGEYNDSFNVEFSLRVTHEDLADLFHRRGPHVEVEEPQ